MFPKFAKLAQPVMSDGLVWVRDETVPGTSWFNGCLVVGGVVTPFIRAQFSEGRLEGCSLPGVSSEHVATTSEAAIALPANHIQIFT